MKPIDTVTSHHIPPMKASRSMSPVLMSGPIVSLPDPEKKFMAPDSCR